MPAIDVFLDLKLHDIPATVRGAALAVADLRPTYLTVHASGGAEMVAAAVDGAAGHPDHGGHGADVARRRGTRRHRPGRSRRGGRRAPGRARAVEAGARAVVCSPREVAAIRAAVGPEITLITPGVRPAGASLDDQRRVATPAQAIADGADLLVIGRPITGADDLPCGRARHCRADRMTIPASDRPEQRAQALEAAMAVRQERARLREALQARELTAVDVIAGADENPICGRRSRCTWLLECLPGIGAVRAERMHDRPAASRPPDACRASAAASVPRCIDELAGR